MGPPASLPSAGPNLVFAPWPSPWRGNSAPLGIHVAYVIIDGAIDTEWIEELFPETCAKKKDDGILYPEDIVEVYWQLHLQKRSSWTQ